MHTNWDYSELAQAYLKRPDYADSTLDALLATCQLPPGARVCDMGAGVAHLTLKLAQRGYAVTAIEPNDAMRQLGQQRTQTDFPELVWREGTAEASGEASSSYELISFGSSFNVTERALALRESARILKPGGWFACLWNHRDLQDPLQAEIEAVIKQHLPAYAYGSRREDQSAVIAASGLFGPVQQLEGRILHQQSRADCLQAWHSHATLQRQAGAVWPQVLQAIAQVLEQAPTTLQIPYTTRIWFAQKLC